MHFHSVAIISLEMCVIQIPFIQECYMCLVWLSSAEWFWQTDDEQQAIRKLKLTWAYKCAICSDQMTTLHVGIAR